MGRGKFITFEGGEGAGKSTQVRLLADRLTESGRAVRSTREPGGSEQAEKIRAFLLTGGARPFGSLGEALLFYAARQSHLEQTIRPALDEGAWVVCDRFSDSTRAYQGAAGRLRPGVLRALERIVVAPTHPDLTVVLDLPVATGLERARTESAANANGGGVDDFESRDMRFHEALREGFLTIARNEPERCVVIDARQPASAVAEEVWEAVVERLQP